MSDQPLASLSLTHVHYDPTDPISYLCAWLALAPQGLCIVYATLIWSSREAEVILIFAGQMGCEACNWLLKRYIKEERPSQMNGKGYGMPSSHAQFVSFFSVSLALFLLIRHQPHPTITHTPLSFLERAAVSLLGLVCAAAVATSRVYLNYHTPKQVLVGCAFGVLIAVFWFMFTTFLRQSGLLNWILEHKVARYFRVRDLVVTEDIMDAGWIRWEEKRRKRHMESSGKKTR